MQNVLNKTSSKTIVVHKEKKTSQPVSLPSNILESKYAKPKLGSSIKKENKRVLAAHLKNPDLKKNYPAAKLQWQLSPHLFLLVLALIGYGSIIYIFLNVQPSAVQHILIPNSYSPILGLFFFASFCLFSFLLSHSRRGFLVAMVLTVCLFLRLQQVLTLTIFLGIATPFLCYEVLMTLIKTPRHL